MKNSFKKSSSSSLLEIERIRLKYEDEDDIDVIRDKFIAYLSNDKDITDTNTNTNNNDKNSITNITTITIRCPVKGCQLIFHSYIDLEIHIPTHTNQCQLCSRIYPNERILNIHLEEVHSSYFAIASLKKPSYICLVDGCNVLSISGIIIIIYYYHILLSYILIIYYYHIFLSYIIIIYYYHILLSYIIIIYYYFKINIDLSI